LVVKRAAVNTEEIPETSSVDAAGLEKI